MTERLRAVLDQVADEMPRPHVSGETWTRARRARRRSHVAAGVAGIVAALAVLLAAVTVPLPGRRVPDPAATTGRLALPASLGQPWSHTSTAWAAPPGRASVAVESTLVRRTYSTSVGRRPAGRA